MSLEQNFEYCDRKEDIMVLSDRQIRILAFIRSYLGEHNYPPTIREIGAAVGISSTSVVKYNLERLEEKGHIDRRQEISRGLRLRDGPSLVPGLIPGRFLPIPKLGVISAGTPLAAVGQQGNPFADEMLLLPQDLFMDTGELYALRVQGDSMIDALVYDGDLVIIKHQTIAQPRDMIVAWIRDREETTLKYYYPEGEQVRLQPANPAYQPIYVPADQLEIQGKVAVIIRQVG
jgi:repressor LexA